MLEILCVAFICCESENKAESKENIIIIITMVMMIIILLELSSSVNMELFFLQIVAITCMFQR